jgi:hypothetical protein
MGELFDLVVVGGGLAGASLAKSMAEHGARVLVLERDDGGISSGARSGSIVGGRRLVGQRCRPGRHGKDCDRSCAGRSASIFPQGKGRARGYFCYYKNSRSRIQGDSAFADFVESCKRTGADGTRDCFSD